MSLRFGPVVLDRGYDDWLGDLAREVALGRAYDDFGRFARNPVQPRDPRITPISGATPPLIPAPLPVPTPGFPGTPAPPPVPGFPGAGGSIPDRIPGRTAAGSIAGFLTSILRGGWIGALFYPSANPGGAGSALCIETEYGPWCPSGLPTVAAPAPGAIPGQRGRRRPRAVPAAPGRRRRRGVAVPGAVPIGPPRPRGRPVTLTRPRIETRPDVAAVVRSPPTSPQPPPMPASLPQTQTVSLPAEVSVPASTPTVAQAPPIQVPSWVRELARLAAPILAVPSLGNWVGAPNVRPNLPTSSTVPLTPIGTAPAPIPQPGLAPSPLTAFSTAPAISPAQELDQQCRARAKQRRKKRKPRSVCYRGTYIEKRNGTLKRRKEKVRCQ